MYVHIFLLQMFLPMYISACIYIKKAHKTYTSDIKKANELTIYYPFFDKFQRLSN